MKLQQANVFFVLVPFVVAMVILLAASASGIFSGSQPGHVWLAWAIGVVGGVGFVYVNFRTRVMKDARERWLYITAPFLVTVMILLLIGMTGLFDDSDPRHIWIAWVFGAMSGVAGEYVYWSWFSQRHRTGKIR